MPLLDKAKLDVLYRKYNHLKFVSPDPLEYVLHYPERADREMVGLLAAGLAYGNVKQIQASIERVLSVLKPTPSVYVDQTSRAEMQKTFQGFKHRWTVGREISDLLWGIRSCRKKHGSLGDFFRRGYSPEDVDYLSASEHFIHGLLAGKSAVENSLLAVPRGGSACKRLHLFLRWMIRKDRVDPGCWEGLSAGKLLIPVDTHIHRVAQRLKLTTRKQANLATSHDITEQFRKISPKDPVRYDFALTRLGIRDDGDMEEFLAWYRG